MFYIYIANSTRTLIKIKLNTAALLFCAFYYTTLKPILVKYIVRPTRMRSNIPLLEPGSPRFFWWYENNE